MTGLQNGLPRCHRDDFKLSAFEVTKLSAVFDFQALYSVGKQQMTLEDLKLPNLEGTPFGASCKDVRFERSIDSSDGLGRLIIMVLLLFDSAFTDSTLVHALRPA